MVKNDQNRVHLVVERPIKMSALFLKKLDLIDINLHLSKNDSLLCDAGLASLSISVDPQKPSSAIAETTSMEAKANVGRLPSVDIEALVGFGRHTGDNEIQDTF